MRAWLPNLFLALAIAFLVPAARSTAAPSPVVQVETAPPVATNALATGRRNCPDPRLRQPIRIGPNKRFGSGARAKAKAASTAMGLVGGLLGGGGNKSGTDNRREEGPKLAKCRIKDSEMTVFTDPETGIALKVGAKRDGGGLVVFAEVQKSPDNGTFQTAFLENENGETLAPSDVQICELWGEWKLTVSWTKSTYVDNQLVSQESGGWEKTGLFSLPGVWEQNAAQTSFWNRLGFSNASHGARMIAMRYPVAPPRAGAGPIRNIIHVTRPRRDPVDTAPFGLQFEEGPGGIVFTREREDCRDGLLLAGNDPPAPAPAPAANPPAESPPPAAPPAELPPPAGPPAAPPTATPPPSTPPPSTPAITTTPPNVLVAAAPGDIAPVTGTSLSQPPAQPCPWPTGKVSLDLVDADVHTTILYGTTPTYTDLTDIVRQASNAVAPHYDPLAQCGKCIRRLDIWGHGGDSGGGYITFGPEDAIAGSAKMGNIDNNLAALRGLMCVDGEVVINQCHAGTGPKGQLALQALADGIGVTVSGPPAKIKSCRVFGGIFTDYNNVEPSAGTATPAANSPRPVQANPP